MDERLAEGESTIDADQVLWEVKVSYATRPAQNPYELVRTVIGVILRLFEIYFTVL